MCLGSKEYTSLLSLRCIVVFIISILLPAHLYSSTPDASSTTDPISINIDISNVLESRSLEETLKTRRFQDPQTPFPFVNIVPDFSYDEFRKTMTGSLSEPEMNQLQGMLRLLEILSIDSIEDKITFKRFYDRQMRMEQLHASDKTWDQLGFVGNNIAQFLWGENSSFRLLKKRNLFRDKLAHEIINGSPQTFSQAIQNLQKNPEYYDLNLEEGLKSFKGVSVARQQCGILGCKPYYELIDEVSRPQKARNKDISWLGNFYKKPINKIRLYKKDEREHLRKFFETVFRKEIRQTIQDKTKISEEEFDEINTKINDKYRIKLLRKIAKDEFSEENVQKMIESKKAKRRLAGVELTEEELEKIEDEIRLGKGIRIAPVLAHYKEYLTTKKALSKIDPNEFKSSLFFQTETKQELWRVFDDIFDVKHRIFNMTDEMNDELASLLFVDGPIYVAAGMGVLKACEGLVNLLKLRFLKHIPETSRWYKYLEFLIDRSPFLLSASIFATAHTLPAGFIYGSEAWENFSYKVFLLTMLFYSVHKGKALRIAGRTSANSAIRRIASNPIVDNFLTEVSFDAALFTMFSRFELWLKETFSDEIILDKYNLVTEYLLNWILLAEMLVAGKTIDCLKGKISTQRELGLAREKLDMLRKELEARLGNKGLEITKVELLIDRMIVETDPVKLAKLRSIIKLRIENLMKKVGKDFLTGLGDKARLHTTIAREVIGAIERLGKANKFAAIFIDVNKFKEINDTLGHLVGDEVLVKVAKAITKSVRRSDLASRNGGDEYIVLIQGENAMQVALQATARIIENSKDIKLDKIGNVSLSIGIASNMAPEVLFGGQFKWAEGISTLVHRADLKMYQAKRATGGSETAVAVDKSTMEGRGLEIPEGMTIIE